MLLINWRSTWYI